MRKSGRAGHRERERERGYVHLSVAPNGGCVVLFCDKPILRVLLLGQLLKRVGHLEEYGSRGSSSGGEAAAVE